MRGPKTQQRYRQRWRRVGGGGRKGGVCGRQPTAGLLGRGGGREPLGDSHRAEHEAMLTRQYVKEECQPFQTDVAAGTPPGVRFLACQQVFQQPNDHGCSRLLCIYTYGPC